jgi:hypothetical protein
MKNLWIARLLVLVVPGMALAEPALKHVDVYTSGADGEQ